MTTIDLIDDRSVAAALNNAPYDDDRKAQYACEPSKGREQAVAVDDNVPAKHSRSHPTEEIAKVAPSLSLFEPILDRGAPLTKRSEAMVHAIRGTTALGHIDPGRGASLNLAPVTSSGLDVAPAKIALGHEHPR